MAVSYSTSKLLADLLLLPACAVAALVLLRRAILVLIFRKIEDRQVRDRWQTLSLQVLLILCVVAVTEIWRKQVPLLAAILWPPVGRALNRTEQEVAHALAGLLDALIVTIVLFVLLKLLWRAHAWLVSKIEHHEYKQPSAIGVQRIRQLLLRTAYAAKLLLAALLFYFYIPILVGRFPRGAPIARAAKPYLLAPFIRLLSAVVAYLPNILVLIVIAVAVRYSLRIIRFLINSIASGEIKPGWFDPDWADPTYKLVRTLVLLLALVVAYPYLPGSGSRAFEGLSLFVGAIITLSSTTAVANAISGIILTYTRSFRIGDRVLIGEVLGDVMEKRLFLTRLRAFTGEQVTFPNSTVLGGRVTNFSAAEREGTMYVCASVGIAYDVEWRKIHQLLLAAAAKTAGVVTEPEPFVLQNELGSFGVTYVVFGATKDAKRARLTASDLRQNIQDTFHQAGVEIMTPAIAGVRDASEAAIPAEYAPKTANAAGLRILSMDVRAKSRTPAGPESAPENGPRFSS